MNIPAFQIYDAVLSPEDYQRSVSGGFGGAAGLVWQLLTIIAIVAGIGIFFWLFFVRQVSLTEIVNRLLASLPATPSVSRTQASVAKSRSPHRLRVSPRRSDFLGSAVISLMATILAHGSIPAGVVLGSLFPRRGQDGKTDIRQWMISPVEARKLLGR